VRRSVLRNRGLLPVARPEQVGGLGLRNARPMPEPWLTTKEAAAFLGVALPTVQKWIQNGQIQAKRMGQKKWLLSRESLSSQLERFGAKAVSAFLTAKPAVPPLQNARIRGPKGRGTQLCSPAPRPEGAGAG